MKIPVQNNELLRNTVASATCGISCMAHTYCTPCAKFDKDSTNVFNHQKQGCIDEISSLMLCLCLITMSNVYQYTLGPLYAVKYIAPFLLPITNATTSI